MSASANTTKTHAEAKRLAAAIRSGLDYRWSIPAPPRHLPAAFPQGGNIRAFLEPFADALSFRMPRGRHPLHRILRPLRCLFRKLSAPWIRFQLRFNLSTMSVLEHIEERVRELEEVERALRQRVEMLERQLAACADEERQ